MEKAEVYRKIGNAYFKKGDWENCERALAKGLKLLGENIPESDKAARKSARKKLVISFLIKELLIHVLHCIFPGFFMHSKSKSVKLRDKVIIKFYESLNWLYILSDVGKFVWGALRTLNFAESKIGKSRELGMSMGSYAALCMAIPLFKRALKYHRKAINLRGELKDEWGVAQSLQWLGFCYCWKGDYQSGIDCFKSAKKIFQKVGDMWELGMALTGLGYAYHYLADYDNGIHAHSQYLEISQKIKDGLWNCSSSGRSFIFLL